VYHYERSVLIRAPIQQLFEFHLNPHNARLISPSWTEVLDVTAPPEPKVGATLELSVKVHFMRQDWVVVWDEIEPPHGSPAQAKVTDLAQSGPFPFWRHQHLFRETQGMVEMTDSIDYMPPYGFLGQWFHFIVAKEMETMFFARHKRTKEILEAAQGTSAEKLAIDAGEYEPFRPQ
jgi:ligand-binding SRPBCC domain-containing protein